MEKKKKVIVWCSVALAVLLAVGAVVWAVCHRNHGGTEPEGPATQQRDSVPDTFDPRFGLATGCYYRVAVDQDTAFVIVESIDDEMAQGKYLPWVPGSDCVRALPFQLELQAHQCVVNADGKIVALQVNGKKFPKLMDGDVHTVECDDGISFLFSIVPYQEPAYTEIIDNRFSNKTLYKVSVHQDVEYAKASGYWTSVVGYEDDSYLKLVSERLKESKEKKQLSLTMDIYEPVGDQRQCADSVLGMNSGRPMIVFLHGGAFYVGDKGVAHMSGWCTYFAQQGYLCASVNYRLGYRPNKRDIEQTGYDAIEDAQNAVRYLVAHAEEYNIDTSRIFLAGTSAGSITALMTAFDAKTDFHVVAVANMWGALNDLKRMRNRKVSIISFHGTADQLVPYDQGIPFQDINASVGKMLFNKLYGSASIDRNAKKLGYRSELYTYEGAPHSLYENADHTINYENYNFIQEHIGTFFYDEMVPRAIKIEQGRGDVRHFFIDNDNVAKVLWKVPGGFVISGSDNEVRVLWLDTTSPKRVEVSGRYKNGIGFRKSLVL